MNDTPTESKKPTIYERMAVIMIVGIISIYLVLNKEVTAGIGFAMNIITYYLSREGV